MVDQTETEIQDWKRAMISCKVPNVVVKPDHGREHRVITVHGQDQAADLKITDIDGIPWVIDFKLQLRSISA